MDEQEEWPESSPRVSGVVNPMNPREAIVFHDRRCVVIDYSTHSNRLQWGPAPISHSPMGFLHQQALSSGIDAVYPSPPRFGQDTHFFCGNTYLSLSSPPSMHVKRGPMPIVQAWPVLREYGFHRVNIAQAVLGGDPQFSKHVWFFSGTRGLRAIVNISPDGTIDTQIYTKPYDIATRWNTSLGLPQVNFRQVDMMLPNPDNQNQLFVFSGNRYVLIEINYDSSSKLIRGPNLVRRDWPSLHAFYR